MARRFQNRFSSNRSARPNRSWTGLVSATTVTVPAASKVLIASFVLSNPGIDETVLRTLGILYVQSDQGAGSELQMGAFGLLKVTDTALAVGITAIPDPVSEVADDNWFVYVPIQQHLVFASAVGQIMGERYEFDSKAKRVLEIGESIAVVAANAHATHGFNISVGFRMLSQVRGTR